MNVQRFLGRNAREAMAQARAAFGDQTVVLSNRPVAGGVEILAMAGAEVPAEPAPATDPVPASATATPAMSTVSFQEFVRERQRQDAAQAAQPARAAARPPRAARAAPQEPGRFAAEALQREQAPTPAAAVPLAVAAPAGLAAARSFEAVAQAGGGADELMAELRSMRSLLSQQLSTLGWVDSVRRSPMQAQLLRLLIGNGFSPTLARQLVARAPAELALPQAEKWLLDTLVRNLRCADDSADGLLHAGGVFALVGPTGVGKTTTCAKLAARFAAVHGAASVGLITVDTYRMAASDQLRGFGRLLNIPVHTARDGASLAELLDLFGGKKLVLVDTVGVGQRDRRLHELLDALPAARLQRLLVLNAAAQGEALDEVVRAYGSGPGTRCVFSKLDEAVKCGAMVDLALRHQLRIEGIANGQRVPEDWHAARPQLLAQKALMRPLSSAFVPDDSELGLLMTAPPPARAALGAEDRHAG